MTHAPDNGAKAPAAESPPSGGPTWHARPWWVWATIATALAWSGAAYYAYVELPTQRHEAKIAALTGGPGMAAAVDTLCADEQGQRELRTHHDVQGESPRARHLRVLLFDRGCLDALDEETRQRFLRTSSEWAVDSTQAKGQKTASRIAELFLEAAPIERPAMAAGLVKRVDDLTTTERDKLMELAKRNVREPWAVRLLAAAGGPRGFAFLWARYSALSGTPLILDEPTLEDVILGAWDDLPAFARATMARRWLRTEWTVRRAGSVGEAQPTRLDISLAPPDSGSFANAVGYVRVLRLERDGEPFYVQGEEAAGALGGAVLEQPGAHYLELDLRSAFPVVDTHKLAGAYEIALLPAAARGQEITDEKGVLLDAWRAQALFVETQSFGPKRYRIFLGIDRGPPKTIHDSELDARITGALSARWRGDGQNAVLRAPGTPSTRTKLTYRHGGDARLAIALASPLPADLALRVQARPLVGGQPSGSWTDIGEGIVRGREPWPDAPAATIGLRVGSLCPQRGTCGLRLRMRGSLRVARADARVDAYWGEQLELGDVTLEVENTAAGHRWTALRQVFARQLDETP